MSSKDSSNTSRTNWTALESLEDEGVDYSDIPPLPEEFFEKAMLRIPVSQAQQLVQVEPDVLQWFQAQGAEYKALINLVLRCHIENQS
ncbi:hypothetical protein EVJ22_15265, partial [Exiguobacterium sp. SH0S7]|uniref:BrnA antitoxin family protein n=1 Tax=Exiguobacterium sp. SH0S7 TaxID=2510951 RepID=UPI00103CB318